MTRRPWLPAGGVDRGAALPLFLQIARLLVADIRRGRLRPGDRLPGSRPLAASLDVHRNTVLAALSELAAEGWIETSPRHGTFITEALPGPAARGFASRPAPGRPEGAKLPFTLHAPPPAYRQPVLPVGTLALSSGAPDIRLVPVRAIGRAYRRVLGRRGAELLAYGAPEGDAGLRAALASMLASTRGLSVRAADVLVTRGSQMALSLVARTLLRPGDTVAVEALGYRPAWEAFRAAGATVIPVAVDGDGIDVEALRQAVGHASLRAVYVTPQHQYPTTVTLKAARRLALCALARAHRLAIIEDDYDHELQFDGHPSLPLASEDSAGLVVYIGTLSKILAPGLRIGYIVAPPAVVECASALRSLFDIQGDQATEAAVATLMEDGEIHRHIARARRVYAARREVLADCLRKTFGDGLQFTLAPGGMALWARFALSVNLDDWARRSVDHGVWWYPGRRYAFDGQPKPYARFSFAWLNESELVEAVRRMAAACPKPHATRLAASRIRT
jgi:GntR family transcriptional regulator/MocR family aminotransferase